METKTFTEIAKENGFDEINKTDDEKFTTIKDYKVEVFTNHVEAGFVDNLDHPHISASQKIPSPDASIYRKDDSIQDVTLCYTLWQNPLYVKLLYLSFLTQVLYSDVLNVKKFIIVTDYKLEPLVNDVFRPFKQDHSGNFTVEVKPVNREKVVWSEVAPNVRTPVRLNKYVVSRFEDLRETDLLILSDCESFMYGKRTSVYSNVHETYQETENFPVLACREKLSHSHNESVFLKRREDLADMMYDDEEYINWCSKRLEVSKRKFVNQVIKRNDWYLTCWFVFDDEKYALEDKHWEEYVNWSKLYTMYCDESIYLTYGWCAKDYDVKDVTFIPELEFIHSPDCKHFFNQNKYNKTGIVHPLHGKWSKDFWVHSFFDAIQNEFSEKLEQAIQKGVGFRALLPQYSNSFYTESYDE